jgi:hypothetical protein
MQGIYNYMPVASHVSRIYNVATVLWLSYTVHAMLFLIINFMYFYISTFRSMRALLLSLVFDDMLSTNVALSFALF